MHSFNDTKLLSYEAELVKDIVLDIEKYPEFLPWCSKAVIISKIDNEIIAELAIDFKLFTENYKSRIIVTENKESFEIDVKAISGPFKILSNFWAIKKLNNGCEVNFSIDFECKSTILDSVIATFFPMATNKIIDAFEARIRYVFENSVL